MSSVIQLRVIPLTAALLFMTACERVDTFNIRVSVYFNDIGETRVLSEVITYRVRHRAEIFNDFDGAQLFFTRTGEAVVIETGGTAYLASYLGGRASIDRALAAANPGTEIKKDRWGTISELIEERAVPQAYWPHFFAVPAGGIAEDIRILDLADVVELGVVRITLQATTDAPDIGTVATALPWVSDISEGALCKSELLGSIEGRPDCARILKGQLLEDGGDE